MSKEKKTKSNEANKKYVRKWGKSLVSLGHTQVPNILIQGQRELNLSGSEFSILLCLLSHWWESDRNPFPAVETLAKYIGVTRSTVQRGVRGLEEKGYLNRIAQFRSSGGGQKPNQYDLDGLKVALTKLADKKKREDSSPRDE